MDQEGLARGIDLLNRQQFFAAHEVLEDVWRPETGASRRVLQGLIQFAVAMHHFGNGNAAGARSILARSVKNLAEGGECDGIDVAAARAQAGAWLAHLDREGPQPPFPRL